MEPRLGDIVIYSGSEYNGVKHHPAVVTRVWTPDCVNVQVFPDCGIPFVKTSIVRHGVFEGAWEYWTPKV